MSGIAKGIGKVFKRVAKVVTKVAPVVLGAAALYFTAGTALGLTGGGMWGQALSSGIGNTILGSSTLAQVVTGAVTQAGYGALAGAATSALTGGDPLKGAAAGALGGAVTGGVMGGFGLGTDPFVKGFGSPTEQTAIDPQLTADTGAAKGLIAPEDASSLIPGKGDNGTGFGLGASAGKSAAQGFFDKGGWLERNQPIVGNLISGIGKGLLSNEGDKYETYAKMQKEQADRVAANYRTGTGWLIKPTASQQPAPPAEQIAAQSPQAPQAASGQLVWDKQLQKLVFVPAAPGGIITA